MSLLPAYTSGRVNLPDGGQMPWVQVGDGPMAVLLIPGAIDGMITVADVAPLVAWAYAGRADRYRMLVMSRRHPLPDAWPVERQAEDYAWALERLGWGRTLVECNSAGGPVGQWLAVQRPELVAGLILSSTLHRIATRTASVGREWLGLAERRQWARLHLSFVEHAFTPGRVATFRLALPFVHFNWPPPHPERMPHLLRSLLQVDNQALLSRISSPALVVGGSEDRIVPSSVQREMAQLLPNSRLVLYGAYGHSNDIENPDYQRQMDSFARRVFA
ncbi:MAG: alpha/beta fold hydrolase [Chloroflexota bacterium]